MSSSKCLIEVALKELGVNQKQLAERLNVSTGQISRWKNHGDYISADLTKKLTTLCKLDETSPEFALFVGSIKNAKRWEKVIESCFDVAFDNYGDFGSALHGYGMDYVSSEIATTLKGLGIEFPSKVPVLVEMEFNEQELTNEQWQAYSEIPQVKVLSELISEYVVLENFYNTYIHSLNSYVDDDLFELSIEIHGNLFQLAACKMDIPVELSVSNDEHRFKWERWYRTKISELKAAAVERKIPLKEELLKLVNDETESVANTTEYEAWGFNNNRIHPDIYMHEILLRLRRIDKVLPFIIKKLGIDEEEVASAVRDLH